MTEFNYCDIFLFISNFVMGVTAGTLVIMIVTIICFLTLSNR